MNTEKASEIINETRVWQEEYNIKRKEREHNECLALIKKLEPLIKNPTDESKCINKCIPRSFWSPK